jgi:hypothetical protein
MIRLKSLMGALPAAALLAYLLMAARGGGVAASATVSPAQQPFAMAMSSQSSGVGAPGVLPPASFQARALPTPIRIHPGLRPGDVIARGNPKTASPSAPDDNCSFDFGIEISIESGSRSVSLVRGPGCTVILGRIVDVNVVEARPIADSGIVEFGRMHRD